MTKFSMFFLIIVTSLFVTSCSTHTLSPVPQLNFTQYPAIDLKVARIEVIEEYKSPFRNPNIEHIMPYSPADAMQIWVKDRLRATGSNEFMQISILDASVIESDLPKTKGIKGLITINQDKKYNARLEVRIRIYGDRTLSEADTLVNITRSITIPENASVNSREVAYTQMIHALMEMLNSKLEKSMNKYMSKYINYSHPRN